MRNYFNKSVILAKQCLGSLKVIAKSCGQPYRLKRFYHFLTRLNQMIASNDEGYPHPNSEQIDKLHRMASGLHPLLPETSRFSYSIIIPVYKPKASYFRMALESALKQTAPNLEVLVGFDGPQPADVYQVVEELRNINPNKLKSFQLDRATEGGSISASTNSIVKHAKGNFILLMDHDDWIRPDLLYLYEKTLMRFSDAQNKVLYCDEYKIDENDNPIPRSGIKKPLQPDFPYISHNWICHCLLVPKKLWDHIGGLRVECNGAQDFDLALRLDLAGAEFHNIPCYLYAWRSHSESTAQNANQKSYVFHSGIRSLTDYCKAKKLDWTIENGYIPSTYKPVPQLNSKPDVHVIIPFRNQKDLTLRTVKRALELHGATIKITAIDNNSDDTSIAEALTQLGVEVLTFKEPFNYARLVNKAVKQSSLSKSSDLLLFLHNDVDLEPNALNEMTRWIDQPSIGMVGCRLNYPDGRLQHGGIELVDGKGIYTEQGLLFDQLWQGRILRLTDAVTGACALIKKETFIDVGGFDEIWNPIFFSDVSLAMKLKTRGLSCLYTPYAVGIHHESTTHKHFEDYEKVWRYS